MSWENSRNRRAPLLTPINETSPPGRVRPIVCRMPPRLDGDQPGPRQACLPASVPRTGTTWPAQRGRPEHAKRQGNGALASTLFILNVVLCGTCMDARGMQEADMVDGAARSNLSELADWVLQADKVIVF